MFELKHKMRIAICVFGCVTIPKYCLQVLKIQETWGRRCEEKYNIPVFYFVGEERVVGLDFPGTFRFPDRIIYLPNVKNDYLSASYKQNLGIKYILDNHPDVDFVYVCGTDTYLNIDGLANLLAFVDPNEKICIGGHSNGFPNHEFRFDQYLKSKWVDHPIKSIDNDTIDFFYGGAGFVLTKAMLNAIYPFLATMTDDWVENCTQKNKTDSNGTCDVCIAHYVYCLGGKYVKYFYRFYECNYRGIIDISKRYGYPRYCVCCQKHIQPHNIISCHNMSLEDFDNFTKLLNDLRTT
jgi:Fringe-like